MKMSRRTPPSITVEPKSRGGHMRPRSGSVGGIESHGGQESDSSQSCGANALCGVAGFSGLPLLGGRRLSLSQDRWICPNDRQLALRAK